jgi:hypothetical protein
VAEPDALREAFDRQLQGDGPTFLRVIIRSGARKDLGRPKLKPRAAWERFTEYLRA